MVSHAPLLAALAALAVACGGSSSPAPEGSEPQAGATPSGLADAPILTQRSEVGPATIAGRLLTPEGAPAAGVELRLFGSTTRPGQRPVPWTSPRTATDGEGRFELRFDPPREFRFTLRSTPTPYAGLAWTWTEIRSGTSVELGSVRLPRTGSIYGTIVDPNGRPIESGWNARADSPPSTPGGTQVFTMARPAGPPGAFLIDNVAVGTARVLVYFQNAPGHDASEEVTVLAGEAAEVELTYTGPALDSVISLLVTSRPYGWLRVDFEQYVGLIGPDGELQRPVQPAEQALAHTFRDLGPGPWTLVVDDPRFETFRQDGLEPGGERVDVRLVGSSGLLVDVIDGSSGEQVPEFELVLESAFPEEGATPVVLRARGQPAPAGSAYRGVVPGSWKLTVRASGFRPFTEEVLSLDAGETRAVVADLDPN